MESRGPKKGRAPIGGERARCGVRLKISFSNYHSSSPRPGLTTTTARPLYISPSHHSGPSSPLLSTSISCQPPFTPLLSSLPSTRHLSPLCRPSSLLDPSQSPALLQNTPSTLELLYRPHLLRRPSDAARTRTTLRTQIHPRHQERVRLKSHERIRTALGRRKRRGHAYIARGLI